MLEDVPCEKFIAIGHIIENMFSMNVNQASSTIDLIMLLIKLKSIDEEDIKHGYIIFNFRIVLGLVNFKENIIDYPNSKDYLRKIMTAIRENDIFDDKLVRVYQRCIENIERC